VTVPRRVRISLWIAVGALIALSVTVAILVTHFSPLARSWVISALKQRYKADVELGDLQISLFPVVRATGSNLVLKVPGRTDLPPLVSIQRFTLDARFVGFFRNPKRIRRVTLEGLQLHIPPKQARPGLHTGSKPSANGDDASFILDEIVADGTRLETLPNDPNKDPLVFDIRKLKLRSVGRRLPMTFHAELQNPKPPGLIHSDGEFGPWNSDQPGDTPVKGKYTFSNADLSVFRGIRGILASSGDYNGALDRIEVHGTTDVPDFALTVGNHPMHLRTEFQATVDGTNGDTVLHPVHAVLDDSAFDVSGSIERGALEKHKEIMLSSNTRGTEIQDFLRLAIKGSKPPMTGRVSFETTVKIPPGETEVIDRLQLNGSFTLRNVRFTTPDIQQKIASLSHHAEGDPKNNDTTDVRAQFTGRFDLKNARITLPRLQFDVPGADVKLNGNYALKSGDIDFTGTARLDATVSQMTTGIKSVLLKPIDPLFRHDGAGAVVPIRISGTTGSPSFKLDIGRVLSHKGDKKD
jgi:hypothetical protein